MRLVLALSASLMAVPALADEVWTSEFGEIIYEEDTADYNAIFSLPAVALNGTAGPQERAQITIYGLGGNFTDRYGLFEGYWTSPGDPLCDTALVPPGGKASRSWGRIQIVFDRPSFPSGFTLLIGTCFWDPIMTLRAETAAG